jgi:hypothetical protein
MSRPTQDTTRNNSHVRIRDYHPLWFNFPVDSTLWNISHRGPTTPELPKQFWFGLFRFRSPLLSESLIIFSSSGYLDVSVLRVCSFRWLVFNQPGCPIRKSTDQRLCAPSRSLSQLITSFIASASQGIRRLPLITFLIRLLYMFIPICQRTNVTLITNYKDPCGEYRSRTDDLLRARQAL